MSKTFIYIITHKNIQRKIQTKNYGYLGVGSNNDLNVEYRDNTLNNIAKKNSSYCELTAQYWISKNVDYQYVGLVHYRRFFYKNLCSYLNNKVLETKYIEKKLKRYDVILPKKLNLFRTVYCDYRINHHIKDLDICGDVIKSKYPTYYNSLELIKNTKKISCYNMIITKKEIYDAYSEWLFDILKEVENRVDTSTYSNYQKRIYGFLSERLLNVYFNCHEEYKILYKPVYQINETNNTICSRFALSFKLIFVHIRRAVGSLMKKSHIIKDKN